MALCLISRAPKQRRGAVLVAGWDAKRRFRAEARDTNRLTLKPASNERSWACADQTEERDERDEIKKKKRGEKKMD